MRPFPLPQVDRPRRRSHAQAGVRTLLVGVLCLFIGLGLGALWQSRRAQGSAPEGDAAGPTAPASLAPPVAATLPVDAALLAEVKRQIPNFAAVSLEEGAQMLRAAALKDLQAA